MYQTIQATGNNTKQFLKKPYAARPGCVNHLISSEKSKEKNIAAKL